MSNEINIEELERLAKAAAPGPWRRQDFQSGGHRNGVDDSDGDVVCASYGRLRPKSFDFIAAANPSTILSLIDRLKNSEAELERERMRLAACGVAAWSKATARAEASTAEPQPGANSAPIEAIGRILTEVMDEAARNGAGSRSMPDDYVEVAAWLCGVGTKTPQPDADGAWKASVIDQLIIAHILTAEHESNPLKAVQDLLAYHADIAVDPRVSGAAAKLVEQAKAEEREACVTLADQLWSKGPGVVMAAIRARGQK